MTWAPCITGVPYSVTIDWDESGIPTGTGEDVTEQVLDRGISVRYGRDQQRQLSPTAIGSAGFSLCNVDREFSPENEDSPLFGNLGPARPVSISASYGGNEYSLHNGHVDGFEIRADRSDRSVDISSLDGLSDLQGFILSTSVYEALRTGQLIDIILDEIGWTAPRDLDPGATHVAWWWAENENAFDAVNRLIQSEGPPSIAYVAPDGTFVFRDRHHRILDERSLDSQAFFSAEEITCETPAVTGLDYTAPFVYQTGLRDIINSVRFDIEQRTPDLGLTAVWESEISYTIGDGETILVNALGTNPFIEAVAPVEGTDFVQISGGGVVTATLSRTSGQAVVVRLTSTGGSATISELQLRARAIPIFNRIQVEARDSTSISQHGTRSFPGSVPWANLHDAAAIATLIVGNFSGRRPIAQIRVVAQDEDHLLEIFNRTISDRVTIRNGELGLFNDFFIEQVAHTIRRINHGLPPVHSVVFGCERTLETQGNNPFTFDKVGAGFDQGTFGVSGVDSPTTVFIFDHPTQGQFDVGLFGV